VIWCHENALPIAYLRSKEPVVLWTDATLASLVDWYPYFTKLCAESVRQIHALESAALEHCALAIYPSKWAAQTAIDTYKVDPAKLRVVPFGPNMESGQTREEIERTIDSRPSHPCKLIFIGTHWLRKGGDVAAQVAVALNKAEIQTELTVIGCSPPADERIPDFVNVVGYLDRTKAQDLETMTHPKLQLPVSLLLRNAARVVTVSEYSRNLAIERGARSDRIVKISAGGDALYRRFPRPSSAAFRRNRSGRIRNSDYRSAIIDQSLQGIRPCNRSCRITYAAWAKVSLGRQLGEATTLSFTAPTSHVQVLAHTCISPATPAIRSFRKRMQAVTLDERTGLLVDRDDAAAIADAIESMMVDHSARARLGEEGRRRALAEASWSEARDRMRDMVTDLSIHS